jgi:hypothetical protein
MSKRSFQRLADHWDGAGRPASHLVTDPLRLLALRCWIASDGARKEGVSARIQALADESEKAMRTAQPDWFDDLLATKSYCTGCGERYSVENLSICTACLDERCYWCSKQGEATNGNRACSCGGEYVG